MKNKKLKTTEILKWGNYLREKWRESFANHLSFEEQKMIGMDHFLWHLCSYEKVKCLRKEEAITAFLNQSKSKFTIFYQFINEAYLFENANAITIKDLPYHQIHMYYGDIYVMDWECNWTFMMTHETDCGPYFYPEVIKVR